MLIVSGRVGSARYELSRWVYDLVGGTFESRAAVKFPKVEPLLRCDESRGIALPNLLRAS